MKLINHINTAIQIAGIQDQIQKERASSIVNYTEDQFNKDINKSWHEIEDVEGHIRFMRGYDE